MTIATGAWKDGAGTQNLMKMFADQGHKIYFVGGCVRNALLGVPVADIDMATDAAPDCVVALSEAAGLKTIPTGIDHGTVTVIADGIPHEITTFRKDVSTDGRRATVKFSNDLTEDARRRDFTMNALYAAADGTVTDPVDGLADVTARLVRFIDDPAQRIAEDYLRILRFFRFNAWYGNPEGGLDADGLAACAEGAEGLEALSAERVGAEVRKLLAAADPAPAVAAMGQSGVLARVMPGAQTSVLAPLVHLEDGLNPSWIRRAAALGGEDITDEWRLSRQDARALKVLREQVAGGHKPAEIACREGAEMAFDVALIRAASVSQVLPNNLQDQIDLGAGARFPIKAQDLMPDHTGASLGQELKRLEVLWIASAFTLTREDLLAQAKT